MFLRVICTCILLGILVAGLWPFHAPGNNVTWSSDEHGLLFGRHGSVVSATPLRADESLPGNSCSIEIWLQSNRPDQGGAILAFYWPASKSVPFALREWRGGLLLEIKNQAELNSTSKLYVDDVFHSSKASYVAIVSTEGATTVYVDNLLVKRAPKFAISRRDLTGTLVVGGDSSSAYNWSGRVERLAIYDRMLSDFEVARSFADWSTATPQASVANQGTIARYLFNEGKGRIVLNESDSATGLVIPERFFILNQQFLERPWNEFRSGWYYWQNVAINVAGFIPLGFFFYAYFSAIRIRRGCWITIALGFIVSLTIEVLQSFLPTRDSGMTDLITNTAGTALGAALYAASIKCHWLSAARGGNCEI
jgi:hypothetical protein